MFTSSTVFLSVLLNLNLIAAQDFGLRRRGHPHRRTLAQSPSDLPGNWTFQGCWSDTTSSRTLAAATSEAPDDMTVENCISFCSGTIDGQPNTYVYAALEYSSQCFCGNTLASGSSGISSSSCNMACSGDATETCGGPDALSLYYSGATADVPEVVDSTGLWQSIGCWSDSVSARSLANFYAITSGATVESCTSTCQSNGYTFAGLEYSSECYCGNTVDNGGYQLDDNICSMACAGDKSELCGGPGAMNLYSFNGTAAPMSSPTTTATTTTTSATSTPTSSTFDVDNWSSLGCYTDSTSARTLGNKVSVTGSLTTESCIAACYALDYTLAGTEFGSECYCDNAIQNSGAPSGDALCSMPCAGDATEMCGGGNRINVYNYTGAYHGPVVVPSVGQWQSQGCYNDSVTDRALPDLVLSDSTVTVEICVAACQSAGYTIAGLEYYHECYCANSWAWGPVTMDAGDCNMVCDGNSGEYCGGQDRLNVYYFSNTTTTTTTSTTSTTTSTTSTSTLTSTTTTGGTTTTTTKATTTTTTTKHTSTPCNTGHFSFSWPFSFSFPHGFPTPTHKTTSTHATTTSTKATTTTTHTTTSSTPCKTSTTPTKTSTTSTKPCKTSTTTARTTSTTSTKPCTTTAKPTTTTTAKATTTTAKTTSTASCWPFGFCLPGWSF